MTLEPPPDRPTADTIAYRQALGAFATGVCVVTADTPQGPMGITVNSFTSVSLNPRLILWCLDERSERWAAFAGADSFAVHILPASEQETAARFARGVALLAQGEFVRQAEGPPRLPEALARLECVAHQRIQMGDHMIVVGRVLNFSSTEGDALTFWRGRYGQLESGE